MDPLRKTGWRRALAACVLCGALLTLTIASGARAYGEAQSSIVGGQIGSIQDLPSLAFIEAADPRGGGFDCTGTVIAPRVILTAAHCAESLEEGGFTPAGHYVVVTGQANPHQADRDELLRVESTHVYPEFDPGNLRGDAAVLILSEPTTAPPIPLATAADAALYAGGATVRLAGWGLMRAQSSVAPKRLRTTTTVVQDPAACKRRTHSFNKAYSPNFQLCTQNPPNFKTGGCFGDSGGPVIAQRADGSAVEIGVVSTGAPFCSTKLPNIFTRVDRLSTWAAGWIAATEAGAPAPALPQAQVPKMTKSAGGSFVSGVLAGALGERFLFAEKLRGDCKLRGRSALKCLLTWVAGPDIYAALVTVFYETRRNAVVWDDHYRIQWVDRKCYLTSAHPKRCAVHTRHR